MRKLTALALLSITLVACKKDTKTVTKVDPATGKTIKVEVPADSVKTVNEVVENPAINGTNGVFTQTFKLKKGETYPLTTYQRNVQTMVGPDGKQVSGTSNSTDDMSFTINDFKDGIYDITINLLGKSNSQTMNGKTVSVDTKGAAPTEPQLKMMWTMNKALVGNKLQMKLKENGEVVSITGFEPIYSKISAAAAGQIKDANARKGFINGFKESFNQNTIKEQFTKNLMVLPKAGAKIGQKWTEYENATPDGSVKLNTTYTLKSIENGLVNLTVTGGIPKKSDKKSQEGMTHSLSSELSQTGTITLDQNTGWVKNQNISVKTTQVESLSDGKQTQSMKSTTTSTVIVNPQNK